MIKETMIREFTKSDLQLAKNLAYKTLTKKYTKKQLEENKGAKLPNNSMYEIINSNYEYRTVIKAIHFARNICSVEELRKYIIRFLQSNKKKIEKANKIDNIKYYYVCCLLDKASNEKEFMKLLMELYYLKLVDFNKTMEHVSLTANSKSFITQRPNSDGKGTFDINKCKKGDFFLRIAEEYNIFHATKTAFNRETRINYFFYFVKKNLSSLKADFNTFADLTDVDKDKVVTLYNDDLLDHKKKGEAFSYELKHYSIMYKYALDIEESLRYYETSSLYCFSLEKGIFALNLHRNTDITLLGLIDILKKAEMVEYGKIYVKIKGEDYTKGFIPKFNLCSSVNKVIENPKGKEGEVSHKTLIIDKEFEEKIMELYNDHNNGLYDTLYANNILLKFI